ncbi:hypothetical protein GH714_026698 [Hevea brasiliensis]|uniref:Wall-associated receptor kinase galacturonan-binding domain-containing protein n=1 Tax=Hevea brasiliensis TaxID=3981 RepID=A0A6A6LN72_HEVBR|nr:hypothetical protein GH714_026698 [Hevea brasiliensis]
MVAELVRQVSFSLALLLTIELAIAAPPMSKLKCKDHCGNISIPYPFGMGNKDCYFNEWAIVRSPIISSNCSGRKGDEPINLTGSPFYISTWNSFIAVGCDIRALLMDDPLLRIGCDSRCHGQKDIDLREMLPKPQTIDSDGIF